MQWKWGHLYIRKPIYSFANGGKGALHKSEIMKEDANF